MQETRFIASSQSIFMKGNMMRDTIILIVLEGKRYFVVFKRSGIDLMMKTFNALTLKLFKTKKLIYFYTKDLTDIYFYFSYRLSLL